MWKRALLFAIHCYCFCCCFYWYCSITFVHDVDVRGDGILPFASATTTTSTGTATEEDARRRGGGGGGGSSSSSSSPATTIPKSRRRMLFELSVDHHFRMAALATETSGDNSNSTGFTTMTNDSIARESLDIDSSYVDGYYDPCLYFNPSISNRDESDDNMSDNHAGGGSEQDSIHTTPSLSYWSYQLCPQQSIRQFHIEPSSLSSSVELEDPHILESWKKSLSSLLQRLNGGTPTTSDTANPKVMTNNLPPITTTQVNNLGKYVDRTTLTDLRESDVDGDDLDGMIVEYYRGGDECALSSSSRRRTKVVTFTKDGENARSKCCPLKRTNGGEEEKEEGEEDQRNMVLIFPNQDPHWRIVDVFEEEEGLCEYVIWVCSTSIICCDGNDGCDRQDEGSGIEKKSNEEDPNLKGYKDKTNGELDEESANEVNMFASLEKDSDTFGVQSVTRKDVSKVSSVSAPSSSANDNDSNPVGMETNKFNSMHDDRQATLRYYLQQPIPQTSQPPSASSIKVPSAVEESQHEQERSGTFPPFPPTQKKRNLELLQTMFQHSYDSYMYHAFPSPEIKPLSCQPGTFQLVKIPALTLIDSLDTLVILGNYTEFARSVERLKLLNEIRRKKKKKKNIRRKGLFVIHDDDNDDEDDDDDDDGLTISNFWKEKNHLLRYEDGDEDNGEDGYAGGLFAIDQNVSVFETNIRVLGGLLSAHQMALAFMNERVFIEEVVDVTSGRILFGNGEKDTVYEEEKLLQNDRKSVNKNQVSDKKIVAGGNKICPSPSLSLKTGLDNSFSGSNDSCFHCSTKCCQTDNTTNVQSESVKKGITNVRVNKSRTYWKYDGILLSLAEDIGRRLLPAFQTKTGIPYGTVNLLHGIPPGETTVASLAGGGTLSIEMELLSRLTGDDSYGKAAKLATRALWARRSSSNLVGKHIDVQTGAWKEVLSGIGSNSDSFYEYLFKHYLLFHEDKDFWVMFLAVYSGVLASNKSGDWYMDTEMSGYISKNPTFESLMSFFPGLQVLMGELIPSSRTLNSFFLVREFLGFLPERFDVAHWKIGLNGGNHPLRPELLESCYFIHMATKDIGSRNSYQSTNLTSPSTGWLWAADFALHTIESLTKTKCGYGIIESVSSTTTGHIDSDLYNHTENNFHVHRERRNYQLEDELPSFFLSETLKYLFLTFDDENILHADKNREWIFTTEAHPVHHVPRIYPERKSKGYGMELKEGLSSIDKSLEETKTSILNMLKDRISSPDSHEIDPSFTDATTFDRLENEKWSAKSKLKDHKKEVMRVSDLFVNKKKRLKNDLNLDAAKIQLFGRIITLPGSAASSSLSSNELMVPNFAFLTHDQNGKGDGNGLSKSCPNHHHSNAAWLHALSGSNLDYSDSFYTMMSSEEASSSEDIEEPNLFTSLSSSANFGIKHFAFSQFDNFCRSKYNPHGDLDESHRKQQKEDSSEQMDFLNTPSSTTRVNMGGNLGEFDVSVFGDSAGFWVRHVKSGEKIQANVFDMGKDRILSKNGSSSRIMVVESFMPFGDSSNNLEKDVGTSNRNVNSLLGTPFSSLKTIFTKNQDSDTWKNLGGQNGNQRTAVISDSRGNSFFCEIILKRIGEPVLDDLEEDATIGFFPCIAATFGPTQMQSLIDSNGVEAQADLHGPHPSDPFGCDENYGSLDDLDNINGRIQIVQRGHCTFRTKAYNQLHQHNATAIIVVNKQEDQLFVMSDNPNNIINEDLKERKEPISVLVSRRDGDEMMNLLQKHRSLYKDRLPRIRALVRLRPQTGNEKGKKGESGPNWPIVQAASDKVQVLASRGWGVLSIRNTAPSNSKEKTEGWQLFILQHNYQEVIPVQS